MGEELDCMVALSWWKEGEQKRKVLDQGRWYYLGRMDLEDLEIYKSYKPDWYRIYLYTPKGDNLTDTGFKSSVVSRRHLKIEPRGCSLVVVDYGPQGKGSLNGTYLSDKMILNDKAVARPGDVIRLGASGPQFMVVGVKGGRQFITLEGGVPTSLPQPLATAIRSTSTMLVKDEAIVTPQPGRYRAGDMVIIVSEVDERETLSKVLFSIEYRILELENILYKERNAEKAFDVLRSILDYDVYEKAIRGTGSSSLQEAYEYLRQYVSLKGDNPYSIVEDSEVQRALNRLRELIREHRHIIAMRL